MLFHVTFVSASSFIQNTTIEKKCSPYFEWTSESKHNRMFRKYSDGTMLFYHGNTSVMKDHTEAHFAIYRMSPYMTINKTN